MTPAERDEVRTRATAELSRAGQRGHTLTAKIECPCDGCSDARAILRYVPPGSVDPTALYPMVVAVEGREIVVAVRGEEVIADAAHMRGIAHALHAASDAAEAAQ